MALAVCIVDTNVIVSGLVGTDPDSPPTRILEAALNGSLLYAMSGDLLDEYASVLRRPRIARRHGQADDQIDRLLTTLVANAMWREPTAKVNAPDRGDDHLWALLATLPQAVLVTGDRLLLDNPPAGTSVVSSRNFVDAYLPSPEQRESET